MLFGRVDRTSRERFLPPRDDVSTYLHRISLEGIATVPRGCLDVLGDRRIAVWRGLTIDPVCGVDDDLVT
jgi:hypothetical protein